MSPSAFDPDAVRRFRFLASGFDPATRTARLEYGLDDTHTFREELVFHGARLPDEPGGRAALGRCLHYLHLAAGVSYYKAAAAAEISVETEPLTPRAARFFERLYRRGLAEFAYRNRLPRVAELRFAAGGETPTAPPVELARRTAVPLGGGKDSIVTLEALLEQGEEPVAISVGDYAPIRATAATAGVERLVVERRLSPLLVELNRRGAYNGHVPVSAIIAFILPAAALLYGFDDVALSNERSADTPDLIWRGQPVNHEYSKGLEFESAVDELIGREVLPGFRYFSFLRPFSELSIAGLFCRHSDYLPVFRSCNSAYRQRPADRSDGWCGDCPKCRFVFLALTPFLPPPVLHEVFGRDLLADLGQLEGYRQLAGLEGERPLECVGEADESAAALLLAAASPGWSASPVVRRLAPLVRDRYVDPAALVSRVLTPSVRHRIPGRLSGALAAVERAAAVDRQRMLALLGHPVAAG